MPLPAALAARLAKRGLVSEKSNEESSGENVSNEKVLSIVPQHDIAAMEMQEEVIAESYDDQIENQEPNLIRKHQPHFSDEDSNDSFLESSGRKFKGFIYCPNKNNIFHDCTKYCEETWKKRDPDSNYLKRKKKMLAKYPLPSHWKEVFDSGIGHYYYWEVDSDSVSWLPPSHPKAVITDSAAVCRQQRDILSDSEDNDSDEKSESSEEDSEDEIERRKEIKKQKLEEIEKSRAKGRNKLKKNDIDPMDPAAYSDIPRGGWSDGLNKGNEAKTGVDVTASGPLYQQRPYPNPGAVLRANAEQKKPPPQGFKPEKPTVNKPEKPAVDKSEKPEKGKIR